MNQNTSIIPTPLQHATGPVRFNMTNDYMFRAVLQSNNKVLRGLICSLLHLSEEELICVEITNPILLGEALEDKEFRLNVNVLLNNRTILNLEMQVVDKSDWPDRSLVYLCRSFDQLVHGQKYQAVQPVIHISFLDYTLFPYSPEFYATYKLLNVKNHEIYNDNFTLSVVNLSRTDLATEEDKKYQIDYWARLFKATTWEEIHMLASKNDYINEASNTIFLLSAEANIRKRCLDREEYYRDIRTYNKIIAEKDALIQKVTAEKDAIMRENDQKDSYIQELLAEIQSLKSTASE